MSNEEDGVPIDGGAEIASRAFSKITGWLRTSLAVAITMVFTVFAFQNFQTLQIRFWSWSMTAPIALVVFIAFALGIVTGYLVYLVRGTRS